MVWVKLADDFTDHPKVVKAGPLAGWLYVCGLGYANKYVTDGFIPAGMVRRLMDPGEDLAEAVGIAATPAALAVRLVEAGLWEAVDGGFRIHDYSEYQPSSEEVKREREAAARRQADFRERKRNAVSNGVTNGLVTGAPYPDPVPAINPDPAVTTSPQPPPPQAEAGGAAKGRRREPRKDISRDEPSAEPIEDPERTPATPGDRELWNLARAAASAGLSNGNAEALGMLEPLGRAADGGLHLRAPPGLGLAKFTNHVVRALLDAGDEHAAQVAIVEGRPGESEG